MNVVAPGRPIVARLLLMVFAVAVLLSALAVEWPRAAAPALAVGEVCTPSRPHASGTTVESISTSSGTRTYRLHVPPSYDGSVPMPVVISSHGAGSNALEQEVYSAFSTKADAEGFIVVYPQGLAPGGSTFFNAWQLAAPDDVGYIVAMLNTVEGQLCTDRSRVFATGMSNGGMLSVRLACSLSSRIAAIAPVTGGYFPQMALNLNAAETCPDTRPVPIIAFHGTADATVPFNGGPPSPGGVDYRLPIDNDTAADDVMQSWAAHNGCTDPRVETQIDTEVRFIEYGSCVDGAAVQLYVVDGGGHTWPGSFDVPSLGYTTQQIDATDLIWSFFTQFTVPDADADLVPDIVDNCPADANFGQENGDRNFIDHPLPITQDDRTALNSDPIGDACDVDDDNDGILDVNEAGPNACGAGTDPGDADSDDDRVLDGAECAFGTDPNNPALRPTLAQCAAALGVATLTDSDGDRLSDAAESCYQNSDRFSTDTDGDKTVDGATDGCEATSFNGDRIVNVADMGMLASAITTVSRRHVNIDVNKDGVFNPADQGLVASFISPSGQCPG